MMNEFPSAYERGFDELGGGGGSVAAMNGTEYLEALAAMGVDERAFPTVQPVSQHRIWEQMSGSGPGATDRAIAARARARFVVQSRSRVVDQRPQLGPGYGDLMDPILRLSAAFHERWDQTAAGIDALQTDPIYRTSLLYLLLSQTSCFRYWGHGFWTDIAQELCRRGFVSLNGH